MKALTFCDAKITSTHTAFIQFKGQFNGAMEEMSGKVQNASTLHPRCRSSCNVQPNQLGRPTRLYVEDPAPTLGIEHHTSGHLRLDSQRAVDADRRTVAHVASEVVRARRHQDLVDRAVADGGGELSYGAHRDLAQLPAVQHEGTRGGAAERHDQPSWDAGDRHGQLDEVEERCCVGVHLPCDARVLSWGRGRAHCVCVCVCHTSRRTLWVCSL